VQIGELVMNKKQHENYFGKGELQNRKLFRDAMKCEELLNTFTEVFPSNPERRAGEDAWQYSDEEIVNEARHLYSFWYLEGGTVMQEDKDACYYRTVRQLRSFLKKHGQSVPEGHWSMVEIDGEYY
tara:strand:- start:44 stop:421 length:378 start_codon:yes stop_codon:yes gene_type:complete